MSLQESASHAERKRKRKKKSVSEQEKARRAEQRAVNKARANAPPGLPVVIPFRAWCRLRGISLRTGERLVERARSRLRRCRRDGSACEATTTPSISTAACGRSRPASAADDSAPPIKPPLRQARESWPHATARPPPLLEQ
jgi:hypothetical protein